MPSSRRRFLTVSAGLVASVGLAGCVGDTGPAGDPTDSADLTTSPTDTDHEDPGKTPRGSETETPPPADAERTVNGVTVALTDMVVKKAATYASIMGSGGVVVGDGEQYVVASVTMDAALDPETFRFENGDRSWPAANRGDHGAYNYSFAGHDGGFVGDHISTERSYILFPVDSPLDPQNPRIVLENGGESASWTLPEAAASTLAADAATFELDSWDAPDQIHQGDPMDVSLSVTNTSDVDGRFLAAVYWPSELVADDDESTIVEATIDAGASTTETVTIDTAYTTNEDGPVELRVEGHVEASKEVQVTDAGTDA